MYIPRRPNPWMQMLPQVTANIITQNLAQKYRTEAEERELKRSEKLRLEQYKVAGYRPSDKKHKPDVMVGDVGLVAPKKSVQLVQAGGMTFPVTMQTPYGETEGTPLKIGAAVQPRAEKAYVTWKTPSGEIQNLRSGVAPPRGSVKYSEPTIQFIGTDPTSGKPLIMNTRGQPNIRTAQTPGKGRLQSKIARPVSAEQQKSLSDLKSIGTSIKDVRANFKSSFVGPVVGRGRKLTSKVFNDPEFVKFKNFTGQLRAIVYGLSGKQINEAELRWLTQEILPGLENPGANFNATLDVLERWAVQKHKETSKAFKDQGLIVGGGEFETGKTGNDPLDSFWK